MSGEMTFTQMVKMIHPDSNPNITNAGEKMREVVKNRKNPSMLYRLAVQWGLVKSESRRASTERTESSNTTGIICVDDMVEFFHPQYGNCRGVVVEIKNNIRNNEYEIFIVTEKGILVAKRKNLYPVGDISRKYRANTELVRNAKRAYYQATRNQGGRTWSTGGRGQTNPRHVVRLEPNTDYEGQNLHIRVNGIIQTVIRTTKDFVVYYDVTLGKEKRKSLRKVGTAYRRTK